MPDPGRPPGANASGAANNRQPRGSIPAARNAAANANTKIGLHEHPFKLELMNCYQIAKYHMLQLYMVQGFVMADMTLILVVVNMTFVRLHCIYMHSCRLACQC